MKRIGLIVGHEPSLTDELLTRLGREPGIDAELALIGGTAERHINRYDVLLDRMSHLVPHYRSYLKAAALAGTTIINDPFRWSADDKFFALSIAARLGLHVPRTVMLPQKQYSAHVVPEHSLKNLEYPLNWRAILEYVQLPAVLKSVDATTRQWSIVKDEKGLMGAYDASGRSVTMLQQRLEPELYLRCLCVGDDAVAIRYDPLRRAYVYHDDDFWLPAPVRAHVLADALKLTSTLGYDVSSVEMAICDGVGWIIDANNPVPDLHREAVGQRYFDLLIGWLAELLVAAARSPERTLDKQAFARNIGRG